MLGLCTASALPAPPSRSVLRYGTSVGVASFALVSIDVLLLLSSEPVRFAGSWGPGHEESGQPGSWCEAWCGQWCGQLCAGEWWWTVPEASAPPHAFSHTTPPSQASPLGWASWLVRHVVESRPIKSVVGYRRLKALKPMPWPLQSVIDQVLIPSWLGHGDEMVHPLHCVHCISPLLPHVLRLYPYPPFAMVLPTHTGAQLDRQLTIHRRRHLGG